MRILHLVKTSEGASWAVLQARELVEHGLEIHVALPVDEGRMSDSWKSTSATIHAVETDLVPTRPFLQVRRARGLREVIDAVQPDLVHSHFFQSTITARLALRHHKSLPMIFQVPGPLHMENPVSRQWDLVTARENDYWLASSQYIQNQYRAAGVDSDRVSVSYYGTDVTDWPTERKNILRTPLGIRQDETVVGSICWMYPPKWYLGHRRGLKNHELIIESAKHLLRERPDVHIVLAGGPWGGANWYFRRLKRLAQAISPSRIHLPGPVSAFDSKDAWADFDCVVHVPISENCGGVIEPLLASRPVVASAVGGIPEVIQHQKTGLLLAHPSARELANSVQSSLSDHLSRSYAEKGKKLVENLFDVKKSARVVADLYAQILSAAREAQ